MITIFNRKELFNTYSMKKQSEIRNTLSSNKIDYKIKTVNRILSSALSDGVRARTGSPGLNSDMNCEYIFYVHKADYDKASYIINKA